VEGISREAARARLHAKREWSQLTEDQAAVVFEKIVMISPFVVLAALRAATEMPPQDGRQPLEAPHGLLDPDPEFRALGTDELLAMVPRNSESVLRRGRALMELGRRAPPGTALLWQVAGMIRDPGNRRLITAGAVSISQLGAAGLIAGGAESTSALAWKLAGEWTAGEQSDFAWLMRSSGINAQGGRSDQIVLHLTCAELLLLAGCVNETIEAVGDWEFPVRLGAAKAGARALRGELANLIARLPPE